ncbi:hypothetical protein BDF14DRAFT_1842250 [Spinellus fusiger]|nr:hypothetical protein BDF14DRAFT_1842250 [Spinellus fusiger]
MKSLVCFMSFSWANCVLGSLLVVSSPIIVQDAVWIYPNSSSMTHIEKKFSSSTYDTHIRPAVNLTQPPTTGLLGILYDRGYSCEAYPTNIPVPTFIPNVPTIALIQRGQCTFASKILLAQQQGALAAIIYDNTTSLDTYNEEATMLIPFGSGIVIPAYYVDNRTGRDLYRRLVEATNTPTMTVDNTTLTLSVRLLLLPSTSKGPNPWELTLIIVVALLATSFFASVGMHWYLWHRRQTQQQRVEQVMTMPLNILPMGKQLLLVSQLREFSVRVVGQERPSSSQTTEPQETHSGQEEQPMCVICLEVIEPGNSVRQLPCLHEYHCHCIDPWLISKSAECPLCKYNCASNFKPIVVEPDTESELTVPTANSPWRLCLQLFRRRA